MPSSKRLGIRFRASVSLTQSGRAPVQLSDNDGSGRSWVRIPHEIRGTNEGAIDEQPEVAPRVTAEGSYTLGSD